MLSDVPFHSGQRVAARVEYHGGHFHGWQAQTKLSCPTVQGAVEEALGQIACERVATVCAGRTDTCLLYTSPSPRDKRQSRMPSSA